MPRSARVRLNNPALLTWARTTAGYSVDDIARHLGKSPEVIEAWERGDAAPTYRQLQDFAAVVRRSVASLYLPEAPDEPPPPPDFRLLPGRERGRFTSEALMAFRELRVNLANLREILSVLGEDLTFALPRWRGFGDVARHASELRELLGVSVETQMTWKSLDHALDEWRWRLFRQGVVVQVLRVPITDVRGFSMISEDLGGIGLSNQDRGGGRAFSLFHEVAHLCLRRPGVSGDGDAGEYEGGDEFAALECYCDSFAAEFLLPREHPAVRAAIAEVAGDFTYDTVRRVGSRFKVSKYVMARRALEVGAVSPPVYWEQREAWLDHDATQRARGWADHVRTAVSHKGKPFVAKVLEAIDTGRLTSYEGAQMLSSRDRTLRPDQLAAARERVLAT